MRVEILFVFVLLVLMQIGCKVFSVSVNNTWKILGTNLAISVEKQKTNLTAKTVERKLILRENYSDKTNFNLARTGNNYSRLNIYQTSEITYLIRDAFETYELNTHAKTLQKIAAPANVDNQKFIGAFDDNENGNWRFISAAERGEIALGTEK